MFILVATGNSGQFLFKNDAELFGSMTNENMQTQENYLAEITSSRTQIKRFFTERWGMRNIG